MWGKRLYSLVIPYGVYSLLAILAHLAFAAVRHQGIREALGGDIFLTITLRGIATLWFLPTLLLAELLFAAIRPESRSRAVKLLLCILMPVLLWAVCWFYECRRGCWPRRGRTCLWWRPRASAGAGSCCAAITSIAIWTPNG